MAQFCVKVQGEIRQVSHGLVGSAKVKLTRAKQSIAGVVSPVEVRKR